MYELVNTSLHNGLIPGTHGFAAVAMTKGLPDALRTRLEAYCAYSHRTSVHDAKYFTENPVNWLHVILPQGEHVMGRVAPAEFDYTGRTNRLARLLVFSKNEIPSIGGASVLRRNMSRLSESWVGEARWLEADKLTVGRLRLEIPPTNCDAPSWRGMFGNAEGLKFAKGFARLLAKNLATTGRTIYFKTSTAHDVDGTKLLALFADLIDLLPAEDRRCVTFSTYPAALPQGTVCHLRGVYDRDRVFDASATAQPWVDCEKGVVCNTSLLPPEEVIQVRRTEPKVMAPPARMVQRPLPEYGGKQQAATAWKLSQKKDGTKSLLVGIMATVTILLLAAAAFGVYLWRDAQRKRQENEREIQLAKEAAKRKEDAAAKALSEAKEQSKREAAIIAKAEMEQKKAEEDKRRADAKRKRDEEQKRLQEAAKREREEAYAKAKREAKKPQRDEPSEFAEVKSVKEIDGPVGILKIAEGQDHVDLNGKLKLFWYDGSGTLTNCAVCSSAKKTIGQVRTGGALSYGCKDHPDKDYDRSCLIWYDAKSQTAYWQWSPIYNKAPAEWFAKTDTIDLVAMCFGGSEEISKTWEMHCGAPCFNICWVTADKGQIPLPPLNERLLKLEKLLKVYEEWENKKQKQEPKTDKDKGHLTEYVNLLERVKEAKKEYEQQSTKLETMQKEVNDPKNKQKQEQIRKEISGARKKIEQIFNETKKMERKWENTDKLQKSLWSKLEFNNCKITGWDELLKNLDEQIAKVKESHPPVKKETEEATDQNRMREIIRHSKFYITKVEGTKQ